MITIKYRIIWAILMLILTQGCYKTVKKEYWSNGNMKSKEHIKKGNNKIVLHGKSTFYYPNKQKQKVQFYKEGILVKNRIGLYENGNVKYYDKITGLTPMVDSIGDGFILNYFLLNYFFTTFYENGKIESKGEYLAGKKQNEWFFYDSLGKERNRIFFIQDSAVLNQNN